jgi:glycosyltransferase involved in cell wall biosynthesis
MKTSSTQPPTISVVLTTFQGERYLRAAMQSILDQTFRDFELIVVDDASQDRTASILREIQALDARVVVVRHDHNQGGTVALNTGLARARGKFIAIMDHDDISLPQRLEKEISFLRAHPEYACVGSNIQIIDESGRMIQTPKLPTDPDKIAKQLPTRNPMFHPTIMFRNDPTIRYREKIRYAMDYDLYLRWVAEAKRIANLPDVLLQYRLSSSSATLVQRAQQELFTRHVRTWYAERLRTGHDSYETFDPRAILAIDPATSVDAFVLREHIAGLFRADRFRDVRAFCRKYFRLHGFNGRVMTLFLASFLGPRAARLKRRFHFLFSPYG